MKIAREGGLGTLSQTAVTYSRVRARTPDPDSQLRSILGQLPFFPPSFTIISSAHAFLPPARDTLVEDDRLSEGG